MTPFAPVSSYTRFLASGRQNLALGQTIDSAPIAILKSLLEEVVPFSGLVDTIAGKIKEYYHIHDPQAKFLGCEYETYTSGSDDYQYRTKTYGNENCTGGYIYMVTYEQFFFV